ncbi:hypothetical protein DIPPA_27436, partial [Diplonema papillatum]
NPASAFISERAQGASGLPNWAGQLAADFSSAPRSLQNPASVQAGGLPGQPAADFSSAPRSLQDPASAQRAGGLPNWAGQAGADFSSAPRSVQNPASAQGAGGLISQPAADFSSALSLQNPASAQGAGGLPNWAGQAGADFSSAPRSVQNPASAQGAGGLPGQPAADFSPSAPRSLQNPASAPNRAGQPAADFSSAPRLVQNPASAAAPGAQARVSSSPRSPRAAAAAQPQLADCSSAPRSPPNRASAGGGSQMLQRPNSHESDIGGLLQTIPILMQHTPFAHPSAHSESRSSLHRVSPASAPAFQHQEHGQLVDFSSAPQAQAPHGGQSEPVATHNTPLSPSLSDAKDSQPYPAGVPDTTALPHRYQEHDEVPPQQLNSRVSATGPAGPHLYASLTERTTHTKHTTTPVFAPWSAPRSLPSRAPEPALPAVATPRGSGPRVFLSKTLSKSPASRPVAFYSKPASLATEGVMSAAAPGGQPDWEQEMRTVHKAALYATTFALEAAAHERAFRKCWHGWTTRHARRRRARGLALLWQFAALRGYAVRVLLRWAFGVLRRRRDPGSPARLRAPDTLPAFARLLLREETARFECVVEQATERARMDGWKSAFWKREALYSDRKKRAEQRHADALSSIIAALAPLVAPDNPQWRHELGASALASSETLEAMCIRTCMDAADELIKLRTLLQERQVAYARATTKTDAHASAMRDLQLVVLQHQQRLGHKKRTK